MLKFFRKCITLANDKNFGDLLDKIFMLTEEMKKINELKEASNKIFLIIKKHRDLLVLHEQIAKAPVSSAKKNWDLLRKFVRSGLISKNLYKIVSKAEKSSLPFKAIIPIPNDPKVINVYSLIDAINRLVPEYREAGQWLFNHLTVFSFKELCNSIKTGCDSLKKDILGFEGYHLLTVSNKSQGYMANMAMRYLPKKKLPESFLEINWGGQGLRKTLNNAKHKNVILFDDASYSGTQIATLLDTLNSDSRYTPFTAAINLYIVVGFISDVAKKKIEDSMAKIIINNTYVKFPLRVKLICQRSYQGIAEQMESELIDESLKEKNYKNLWQY